jgi:CRISPR/Cas system CMR-associated protein Cmr3 (group 5 of RAMP superfamily)
MAERRIFETVWQDHLVKVVRFEDGGELAFLEEDRVQDVRERARVRVPTPPLWTTFDGARELDW